MLLAMEKKIIAALKRTLGSSVRAIDTHPGRWGKDVIEQMLIAVPAVYVGFSGGSYKDMGRDHIASRWHVYALAESLNSRRELGAYQLGERVLVCLHDLCVGQQDSLRFKSMKNLFSFAQGKQGYCCYELIFEVPIKLPDSADLADYQPNHQGAPGNNGQGNDLSSNSIDPWLRGEAKHADSDGNALITSQFDTSDQYNGGNE